MGNARGRRRTELSEYVTLAVRETAYAKLNLALHVRRRREDGYHDLETLFAFLDDGDCLNVDAARQDRLSVTGEFAWDLTGTGENIVEQALALLPRNERWAVLLEKRLPVAAGLGGGSADAAAIFRLVGRLQGLPDNWHEMASSLGADVPACVESLATIGRGTGTELGPVNNDLFGAFALLVNPRIQLSTGPVFNAWDGHDRGPLPGGTAREIALAGRNDLEEPAIALCPAIGQVLEELRQSDPMLARMSGSGATCFALFEREDALRNARTRIERQYPHWWTMAGTLR